MGYPSLHVPCYTRPKKKIVPGRESESRKEGGLVGPELHVSLLLFNLCNAILELIYFCRKSSVGACSSPLLPHTQTVHFERQSLKK